MTTDPADDRLREGQQQYRQIFEATSDGIIINDFETGLIVEINPAFCAMHGYTHEELVGIHPTTFIHPDSWHLFDAYMHAVREGRSFQAQAVDLRKDGTPFPIEVHGSLFTYHGKPHVLGVLRDITERLQAQRAAQEERQRLARELHDSVTQSLFSITMHTRAAQLSAEREGVDPNGNTAQNIQQLRELSQGALAEMRALIFELRPDALREEGLTTALRKHAAAVSAREGLTVDVDAPNERLPLPSTIEEHLYRLAQEALHNVVKHADAAHALVQLVIDDDGLTLRIADDGQGFDPAAVPGGHLGLQTMTERSQRVNGVMAIRSTPGAGTTIQVTVPRTALAEVATHV